MIFRFSDTSNIFILFFQFFTEFNSQLLESKNYMTKRQATRVSPDNLLSHNINSLFHIVENQERNKV